MLGIEASVRSAIADMERQAYELRFRLESERFEAARQKQIALLELYNPGALRSTRAALACDYCGRAAKSGARAGDGCVGCGAPLPLAKGKP